MDFVTARMESGVVQVIAVLVHGTSPKCGKLFIGERAGRVVSRRRRQASVLLKPDRVGRWNEQP